MRIEVHDGDGLIVDGVEGAQGCEGYAVVAAEGDDSWVAHSSGCGKVGGALAVRRCSTPQLRQSGSYLLEGEGIVEGRNGNIAAVEDFECCRVRVKQCAGIERANGNLPGRGGTDGARPEPRAGAVGDGGVEGNAEDGDIVGDGRRG